MQKNNVPLKVAIGYTATAIVLIMAMVLVYSNTKSIYDINQASREYIQKQDVADSTMTRLLKEEQNNLKQLSEALAGKSSKGYLRAKVDSLSKGKDSIVVEKKAPQTHEAKHTTVEVLKTRRGFFRRLADAFKKEHAETISVKRDTNLAVVDSVATPINVAENVANILEDIEKKEKKVSTHHSEAVNKEMEDLQLVNAQLALRSAKKLNEAHQKERTSMQHAINKAMEARQQLIWQIAFLAIIAIIAAIILLWYIYQDTKKERVYRENLENANEEIQRIMRQRERLLLTITHDIKAPAASISGFIDLMKEYVSDPKGTSCLSNIKNSASHLSQLVASLLDYHQLENGLMQLNPVNFSPEQLVKLSVEGLRLQAEKKGLAISCEFQNADKDNIWGKIFRGDDFRIRQVLDNLVSNAIKYTDQGSVHIMASIRQARNEYNIIIDEHTYELTLQVKDTGKGMTSEEKQKVFQAFTRLKGAQGIEGTGLGLSITRELVALLGGKIQLESAVGKGSTFTVSFPILLQQQADAEEGTERGIEDDGISGTERIGEIEGETRLSKGKDKQKTKRNFANHKILILDDDALQLQLLQEMLRRLVGDTWKVITYHHVTEALTALHNEQPAVMMMDIEMPEMNGMEMIKHINHSQMLVIAMTAHDTSIKSKLHEAGFDDCLFKPFSMEKLEEILGIERVDSQKEQIVEKGKTTFPVRFKPLLAFAEDDEDAAAEIISTVKQELEGHFRKMQDALSQETLPCEDIGKAAHKLLPIASMIQMENLELVQALAPEHINEVETEKIREYLATIVDELRNILGELSSGAIS